MKLTLSAVGALMAAYAAAAPIAADDAITEAYNTFAENVGELQDKATESSLSETSDSMNEVVHSVLEQLTTFGKRDHYIDSNEAGLIDISLLNNDLNHILDIGKRGFKHDDGDTYVEDDDSGLLTLSLLNNDLNHIIDIGKRGSKHDGGDTYVEDDDSGLLTLSLLNNDLNHILDIGKRGSKHDGGDTYVEDDKAGLVDVPVLDNDLNHLVDVGKRDVTDQA